MISHWKNLEVFTYNLRHNKRQSYFSKRIKNVSQNLGKKLLPDNCRDLTFFSIQICRGLVGQILIIDSFFLVKYKFLTLSEDKLGRCSQLKV